MPFRWLCTLEKHLQSLFGFWHTDRGSQYASDSHRELLSKHDILQSMSRKGDCWANAVSESFFHSLRTGLVHHERIKTRAEANQSIFEYIVLAVEMNQGIYIFLHSCL